MEAAAKTAIFLGIHTSRRRLPVPDLFAHSGQRRNRQRTGKKKKWARGKCIDIFLLSSEAEDGEG